MRNMDSIARPRQCSVDPWVEKKLDSVDEVTMRPLGV